MLKSKPLALIERRDGGDGVRSLAGGEFRHCDCLNMKSSKQTKKDTSD